MYAPFRVVSRFVSTLTAARLGTCVCISWALKCFLVFIVKSVGNATTILRVTPGRYYDAQVSKTGVKVTPLWIERQNQRRGSIFHAGAEDTMHVSSQMSAATEAAAEAFADVPATTVFARNARNAVRNASMSTQQAQSSEFRIEVHGYVNQDEKGNVEIDQENVFRLTKVPQPFVNDVMFATSMVFYLEEFIEQVQDTDHGGAEFLATNVFEETGRREFKDDNQRKHFFQTKRALSRLIIECTEPSDDDISNKDPMRRDGKPRRNMQQLFLRQGVTQIVMVLLRTIGEVDEFASSDEAGDLGRLARLPMFVDAFEIATLGWRFVRQACKAYPDSGAFIVREYSALMLEQMPYGLRVMDALVEVFHDNHPINMELDEGEEDGQGMFSTRKQLFEFAMNNIREIGPVSKFVDFLTNMVSNELPGEDQPRLYRNTCVTLLELLKEDDFNVFMQTRMRGNIIEVNACRARRKSEPKELSSNCNWVRLCDLGEDAGFSLSEYLVQKAQMKTDVDEEFKEMSNNREDQVKLREPRPNSQFHIATLRLMSRLCVEENKPELRERFPLMQLLCGVSDEDQQNFEMRAAYCQLLTRLWIPTSETPKLVDWLYPPAESEHTGLEDTLDDGYLTPRRSDLTQVDADFTPRARFSAYSPVVRESRADSAATPWRKISRPSDLNDMGGSMFLNVETGETLLLEKPKSNHGDARPLEPDDNRTHHVLDTLSRTLLVQYDSGGAGVPEVTLPASSQAGASQLAFQCTLVMCIGYLLRHRVTNDIDFLKSLEDTIRTQLAQLHQLYKNAKAASKFMFSKVAESTSWDTQDFSEMLVLVLRENLRLLDILYDLSMNPVVMEFCKRCEELKQSPITAREVHGALQKRWNSNVDVDLRDQLIDLLAINCNDLRNWCLLVLEKLHGRQSNLLKALKSVVYMSDTPQALFVQAALADAKTALPTNNVTADVNWQQVVNAINALTRLIEDATVQENPWARVNMQNLMRQSGVHKTLHDGILLHPHYVTLGKQGCTAGSGTSELDISEDVLMAVFHFLDVFCANNLQNQSVLQETVACMWDHYMGLGLGTAATCSSVYDNNREFSVALPDSRIIDQVKLCSTVVNTVYNPKDTDQSNRSSTGSSRGKASGQGAGRYAIFLRTIMRSHGRAIRVNQDRILKALLDDPSSLDEAFWLDNTNEARAELNLPKLITATKGYDNHLDPESRLSYHIELLHLLAACVQDDNESCARKLRARFPINLLTSGVKSEELDDRVRVSYMLLCDALYVSPCATEPSLATEFFLESAILTADSHQQYKANRERLSCLANTLEAALRLLSRDEAKAAIANPKTCEHLFPSRGREGGAVCFIASLYESNILETIEEANEGIVSQYFGRVVEPVVVVNSLCELMRAVLQSENVDPVRTERCRRAVSALSISTHFDSDDTLIGAGRRTSDRPSDIMSLDQQLKSQLEKHQAGIASTDLVTTFDQMLQLAASAWDEQGSGAWLSWSEESESEDHQVVRTTEENWHLQRTDARDQFELRRFLAQIIAKGCSATVTDTESDIASLVDTTDSDAASVATTKYQRLPSEETAVSTRSRILVSLFDGEDMHGVRSKGRMRTHRECSEITTAILDCVKNSRKLSSTVAQQHYKGQASANTVLLFACINGALLYTGGDSNPQDQQGPNVEVQKRLADMHACDLVCSYLSSSSEHGISVFTIVRVVRLGILLLDGGNDYVQDVFKKLTLADADDNRRCELLENIREHLRTCLSNGDHRGVATRNDLAYRLLRFMQLLCEGHNSWWQNFLRTQGLPSTVDMVCEVSNLFVKHMKHCLQKIPAAALMKALPDMDPRHETVQTALDMLTQFATTLTEMCQGPNVDNQHNAVYNTRILDECPELLWFLTRRQQKMVTTARSAEKLMSRKRIAVRKRRLMSFCISEGAIIALLLSMVEGGAGDVIARIIATLKKVTVRAPTFRALKQNQTWGDGLTVLVANMNLHADQELEIMRSSISRTTRKKNEEYTSSEDGWETIADPVLFESRQTASHAFSRVDNIVQYYILLQTLADKGGTATNDATEALTQWTRPEPDSLLTLSDNRKTKPFQPHEVLAEIRGVVRQIEILREGNLEVVYFPVPKTCIDQLSERFVIEFRQDFENNWLRENPSSRVRDLVQKIPDYQAIHDHQCWITECRVGLGPDGTADIDAQEWRQKCGCRPLHMLQKAGFVLDWWTVINTLVINILLMYGFDNPHRTEPNSLWLKHQLRVQSIVHCATSSVKVFVYFLQHPLLDCQREVKLRNSQQKWKDSGIKSRCKRFCNVAVATRKLIFNRDAAKTIYMGLYLVCSISACVYDYFIFAFHLIDLMFKISLLRIAVDAIFRNFKSLVTCMLMGLVFIYIYAVLGWRLIISNPQNFNYGFNGEPEFGPDSSGVTFLDWVVIHWDLGLRSGPQPLLDDSKNGTGLGGRTVEYLLLSISYSIIVVLVLGAVIAGTKPF
eukprot:COSAG01_NODE_177_length_22954_cov_28.699554_13_plen_2463_part_00